MSNVFKSFVPMLMLVIVFSSCDKDDEPRTEFDDINDWMYSVMDSWYYWNDELRNKPETNINPGEFYNNLLVPQDRFSFFFEDYQTLVDRLNGVKLESGFEFRLFEEPESENNISLVLWYVKAGSPAALAGLRRGDIMYAINGQKLTQTNFRSLLDALETNYSAGYRRYDFDLEDFVDQGQISITPTVVTENPFLLDTMFDISGRKIGYLAYTRFSNGPTEGSTQYVDQMDMIFANFKAGKIDEFILDLRFNPGGSEVSARNLTSLMVDASGSDLMFKRQYNDEVQDFFLNDERYGERFLNTTFLSKDQNISSLVNRIFIITSNRSSSASELVINCLTPYMDVFIVGDTTVGKDVGSSTFSDQENENNSWAIQPIIVKLVNARDEDYPDGLIPNIAIKDNSYLHYPLGDPEEPLLNAALSEIGVQTARAERKEGYNTPIVYESIVKRRDYGLLDFGF